MTRLEKLWRLFNNKKTNIGSALLLAALFIRLTRPEQSLWADILVQIGEALGGTAVVVGLTHKGVKAAS